MPSTANLGHALAVFLLRDEAGVTMIEFVLVGSLIATVCTLVWLAWDKGL